ncbi:ferrous iron transport protein B [Aminiphilus circumscriptus]|uniref:ferrous iron transport protein B n=1 Tax=Aminiphilus circumscriptus TaxID=290732 RepID=UPI0004786127|nr:ferrous iron transport protein B [Aminiphilus circumscriptus]
MGAVIALAGNPNTGKTSLFNRLTGSRASVGNWPGVTVERKEGLMRVGGEELTIVDLPGIYSLGAASVDEQIAAEFILRDRPDVAVVVVDASNLERSLYLVVQLLEMGQPAVVALNMVDAANSRGIQVDVTALERLLGVPVVPTVATSGEGVEGLKTRVAARLAALRGEGSFGEGRRDFVVPYGERVERVLRRLEEALSGLGITFPGASPRLAAVKLAEGDTLFLSALAKNLHAPEFEEVLQGESDRLEKELGYDLQTAVIERRWGFLSGVAAEAVRRDLSIAERLSLSDRIDRVVTHRLLGLPLFLGITWLVFTLTYLLGDPTADFLDGAIGSLGEWLGGVLASMGAPPLLQSFVMDGVVGGVGSVVVFFPHIFLLFVFIAALEDSGYMARGAFVMDRIMHFLGLHGKSFIPMLLGFGCNVPSIMSTRILDRPRDRMITLLVLPFMSCSARLPVYVLFAGVFFGERAPLAIFSLYVLGILVAVAAAKILGSTLFKGESSHLVMELPPYHLPTLRGVFRSAWERGAMFLKKAGTFIFAAVILVWAGANLPLGVEYASQESLVGRLGSAVAPLLEPAGFGSWQAGVALVFGLLAKEVVVGAFGTLLGVGEEGIAAVLPQFFTPLAAYAFLVMTLLYIPCVAVIAAFKRETNSWKWTGFLVLYTTLLAYGAAVLVYQGGRLLGLG